MYSFKCVVFTNKKRQKLYKTCSYLYKRSLISFNLDKKNIKIEVNF